ncbi:MAG: CsgG/HfaB family protein [Vicinamibacteria bacterium]
MSNRTLWLALAGVAMIGTGSVRAALFAKPKIAVPVHHAPQMSLPGVTRIAVGEVKGSCGRELGDHLTQALVESGKFEVLTRDHLEAVLREANFQFSGVVDSRSAGKLGQILGAAALVFGHVTACDANVATGTRDSLRSSASAGRPRKLFSIRVAPTDSTPVTQTTAYVAGSLQLVELTTAKIYTARAIDGRAERIDAATVSSAGTTSAVLAAAHRAAVGQFLRAFLPWDETVELVVHDDEKWGLKVGAAFVRAGDFAKAAEVFQDAVGRQAGAEGEHKMLGKAYHNLGIALMYSGRAAQGQEALMKSISVHPTEEAQEALRSCRQILATEKQLLVAQVAPPVTLADGPSAATARKCPHCRGAIDADTRFCPGCGKKIEAGVCPKCGRPVSASQKFCPNDGAKLF